MTTLVDTPRCAGPEPEPVGSPAGPRRPRLTEPRLRTALLVLLAVVSGALLVRPDPEAAPDPVAMGVLADEVAAVVTAAGATDATGTYLAGTGLTFTARTTEADPAAWLAGALAPTAARFGATPADTMVLWQLATGSGSRAVRMTAGTVADPAAWTVGAGAGAATAAAAGAGPVTASAAAATPTAAPSAAPSATPSTAPSSTPSATPSSAAATAAPGGAASQDFAKDASAWKPLGGTWAVKDGVYSQTDESGYDFISQLTGTSPAAYTASVRVRTTGTALGAGLVLGQPKPGTRDGATVVDATAGNYLRWGTYKSPGGSYTFTGGASLPAPVAAGEWHTLAVTVSASTTTITWDGATVGETTPVPVGGVALVTSKSKVDFDDLSVVPA